MLPKHSFKGGVHPMHAAGAGKSQTKREAVRDLIPDIVAIPMSMHLGASSRPCVQQGEHVKVGQVIGEPVGFLGLPVHASIAGEVIAVEQRIQLGAAPATCVVIKNDFTDEWIDGIKGYGNVETLDPSVVIPAVKAAGICGLGGASFPTHVKLSVPEGKKCEVIILNGAECETHLTSDHRLMLENPTRVVDGLRAVMRALNVSRGVIAIEDNKPDAIEVMREHIRGREGVELTVVRAKYPQGSEKQLIRTITGHEVPRGGLPIDVGTIVLNVATAAAIADALIDGRPFIDRITTVTGHVKRPSNLRLRIGTMLEAVIGECGGYNDEAAKIIVGGAMTGFCAPDDTISIAKGTGGIIVLNREESEVYEEGPCIRCGRCVDTCPVGLNPYLMKRYCDANDIAEAEKNNVMDCILCGCCSFTCPSRRFLTASFKIAKERIAQARKR